MSFVNKFCGLVAVTSALFLSYASAITVNSTILVLAPTADVQSSFSATSGLDAYGIPYQLVIVPSGGTTLPALNSSATAGNFGGILILSDVSYDYSGSYNSAITTAQYNALYAYQTAFGVRMVRLDVYPGSDSGTTAVTANGATGCCADGVEQTFAFTNSTGFPTANIKTGATVSTLGLYHYPAKISSTANTWAIAQFGTSGGFTAKSTAAVINIPAPGRQQMVFFIGWASEWSSTSNYLQHAYVHWMTRGLFTGARKVYFGTQIDDMHLTTALWSPAGAKYRVTPDDMSVYQAWTASVNSRLPAGSQYFVEIGHNGNGDIINSTNIGYSMYPSPCQPVDAIYYASPVESPDEEYIKPIGSGLDLWPASAQSYNWTLQCAQLDKLATWFMNTTNRDVFAHISHTFTHLNLDNATFNDATREIYYNQAWLAQVGISAGKFSPHGLIPPAITGLHNGDVIRAWFTNGITNVVGDNSRDVLLNPTNVHWPLISNVSENGYAGLNIIPRWPTSIFFDCDTANCTTLEWTQTQQGDGTFTGLLAFEKDTTMRYLLGLRHDPYMFHQANLRSTGVGSYKVGTQTVKSIFQIWVETMTQEITRLTNWPLQTLKHDDIGTAFLNRMARDACGASLAYTYGTNGKTITAVTLSAATGNKCSTPIPVTVPGTGTTSGSATSDKTGAEPLIFWVTLNGSPVTINLGSAVTV
nr:hypothetical protein B0A51_00534 [Rachicladosporium sp. CCFEE 5018]